MPIAQTRCGRMAGHVGSHQSEEAYKRGNSRAILKVRLRKAEWDRVNRKNQCPSCGGLKRDTARYCKNCRRSTAPV